MIKELEKLFESAANFCKNCGESGAPCCCDGCDVKCWDGGEKPLRCLKYMCNKLKAKFPMMDEQVSDIIRRYDG